MTTAGVKCNAGASVHISGTRFGFQLSIFCLAYLRVAVVLLPGTRIDKVGMFPHKQSYPTSEIFSNYFLFHSSFSANFNVPSTPACCDWNILFNMPSRTWNPFLKQHFSLVHTACRITQKWVQTLLEPDMLVSRNTLTQWP